MQQLRKGFTLVELLIVVAIIAVLSTVGVPTFRKMIAKARQAEAKVALGAIYRAESALLAEYNLFSNNLAGMGIEMDMTRYNAGFSIGACKNALPMVPLATDTEAKEMAANFPGFFDAAKYQHILSPPDATAADKCQDSVVSNIPAFFTILFTSCGQVECTGQCFVAAAAGAIAPNVTRSDPLTKLDVWTINQRRELVNLCTN